jgi:Arc/MetJ-type ribon-helix-helix transcriptional regulator
LEALVNRRLATGAYADAEEVVRCALEALEQEDAWTDQDRQELDDRIDRAMSQFADGKGIPGEVARTRLQERKSAWLRENPNTST